MFLTRTRKRLTSQGENKNALENSKPEARPDAANPRRDAQAFTAPWIPAVLFGWIVPGGGHLFLRRTGRGMLLFVSVVVMFVIGIMMRGPMFEPQGGDMLTMLIYYGGFLSHIATGAIYFVSVALGYRQPDIAGHVYDYGSKFLVGAGLLNILGMVDAFDIATGKKS
jgi:hypothetical protein